MREEERILAGLLFSPADPELRRIKQKTHNLNIDYNQTHEDEMEKRAAILREMLGELGEGCFFQGPIHFHYGIHTKIGKGLFANFNLTGRLQRDHRRLLPVRPQRDHCDSHSPHAGRRAL